MVVGADTGWHCGEKKPPRTELALRPPGPRVVLAPGAAEWALSQTSVCSLLLELRAGRMNEDRMGGGELKHSATTSIPPRTELQLQHNRY